jgi:uncharacterized protein
MKIIVRIIIFVLIFTLGVRYLERKSIYFPVKEITNTPRNVGLGYQEVYFYTSDQNKIHGWFIPRQGAQFTILFSHGNAGNIGHRLDKVLMLHDLGFNIFIYDYRGYGKSRGFPSEKGFYRDIRAAYNYLLEKKDISYNDIVLYGESIGGAVSVELASRMPVRALITENVFTSIKDMAEITFPLIPYFIFSSRFNSLEKIQNIACAKLIIHSFDDEIVPFEQGKSLFDAAASPKVFLRLRGGHNTAFWDSVKEYKQGIMSFMESLI